MKDKLRSITNIPFLISLGVLLLNDFHLKQEYHNVLTGKLSDFCGLFVFVSFWSALLPNRKKIVYFSTALIFIVWKSSYSQPFIDLFSQTFYTIHRVVDSTDLIGLLILPIAYFNSRDTEFKVNVNPVPIVILSFISFCSTSVPRPTQKLSQPQYVLFKSGVVNFSDTEHYSDYQIYNRDSLIVISVKEIEIDVRAALDDEYHKTQILTDLDLRLLRVSTELPSEPDKLSAYITLRDRLTVNGVTSIALNVDTVIDLLIFKNTRLEGHFKRLSDTHRLLIDGKFKNGVEDSVWSFYDSRNEIVSRKYFENGELIRIDELENSKLTSTQRHNSRADTIRNKYFHMAIIGLSSFP